jgi:hypothetical protein
VPAADALPSSRGRVQFLDACRALAVLAMLFANMMNVFLRRVPEVLNHNEGDVLRAFDFPAPVFQFLIGVSLVLFLDKRSATGLPPLAGRARAMLRFSLLIALGILLDGLGGRPLSFHWGVLQTLGLGGLIATALVDLPDAAVGVIAFLLLVIFSGAVNGEVHRQPVAALAFVPLTLGGLVVGRGLLPGAWPGRFLRRGLSLTLAAFVAAAAAYLAGVPFNKVLGSSSFVALATGVSALLLLSTASWERSGLGYPRWLIAVGANALTAWVLMYVLVYYPAWLVFPAWSRLPLVPGMVATLAVLSALAAMSVALGRRGIRIPI